MSARILIVDDDLTLLEALSGMLRLHIPDLSVETCASVSVALGHVEGGDYDAIISDIRMPGMDGFTFLQHVLKWDSTTPTLLMTGHGDRDIAAQAFDAGAYAFIEKPIDRIYFIAWVKRALSLKTLTRAVMTPAASIGARDRLIDDGARREPEETLRGLLDATGVIPWEADARTWLFTKVGPQAVTLLGYPLEQWYEKDFWAGSHSSGRSGGGCRLLSPGQP